MDINTEFDQLLIKYGFIGNRNFGEVEQWLNKLLGNTDDRIIGLYGAGIEAIPILKVIENYLKNIQIDYCFDKKKKNFDYKSIIKNQDVYLPELITEKGITHLFIASKSYGKEMRKQLEAIGYQGVVIDMYDEFADYIADHFVDYKVVFEDKEAFMKDENQVTLKRLIKDYLVLKDFNSAFYYMDMYVKCAYADENSLFSLKMELNELLNRIKKKVNCREYTDIIINWVDALSFYDIEKIPFLNKIRDESVEFENAYTVIPWTTETTKTIMFGEYPIEGKLYNKNVIATNEAPFLKHLKEKGYQFVYCGIPKMSRFYDKEVICPIGLYDSKWASSIPLQWNAIAQLCKLDKPICVIIHNLRETHEPFVSGRGETCNWYGSTSKDWAKETMRKQSYIADNYISEQLEFYYKYYGKKSVKIYMSDHGRVDNSPLIDSKIHTMLFINGKELKAEKVQQLFSLVDFHKLTKQLLDKDFDWYKLGREYVRIENLDAYSSELVEDVLSGRLPRIEMCQCRGIVTEHDRYFVYYQGEEYYFTAKGNQNNLIQCQEKKERIEQLKRICGTEFVDIYQEEKFKYARVLYSKLRSTI